MKSFIAGLVAIAAMVLSLELLSAAEPDNWSGDPSQHNFPGIGYPAK